MLPFAHHAAALFQSKRDPRSDGRRSLDALLRLARSGGLPERFRSYQAAKRRYCRWSERRVFGRMFEAITVDPDLEWLIVDSTIVRAQAQAAGGDENGELKLRQSGRTATRNDTLAAYPLGFVKARQHHALAETIKSSLQLGQRRLDQ